MAIAMTDGSARLERVLDDDTPPPPMTFAQRRRIAVAGGLAILAAAALLVWALSGDHTGISARDELTAAQTNHKE